MLRMRQQLGTYCNESSFAPLAQVSKARSTAKKISWAVISIAMTAYMVSYCATLLMTYFSYPIKFSIELAFSSKQEFPSITLCNLNPIKRGAIRGTEHEKRFARFPLNGKSERSFIRLEDEYAIYRAQWTLAHPQTPPPPPLSLTTPLPAGYVSPELGNLSSLISQIYNMSGNWSAYTPPPDFKKPQLPTGNMRLPRRQKREAEQLLTFDQFMQNISYSRWDDNSATNTSAFFNNQSDDRTAFSELLTAFDPADRKLYSHKLRDMLLKCEWKGFSCAPSNFSQIDNHKFGQCFTFNPATLRGAKQSPLTATSPGPLNGLVMELYVEQAEYIPVLSPQAGFRVLVHTRGQMPFPEAEGFTISPGFATIVGIKKTSVSRIAAPYGVCVDHGTGTNNTLYGNLYGVTYSKEACLRSCLQTLIIDRCKCAYPRYVVPHKARVCRINKALVAACVSGVELQMQEGSLDCNAKCPESCDDEAYDLTISSSMWPSENYKEDLRNRLRTVNSKMINVMQNPPAPDSIDRMPGNILKLEVYFQELNYQKITQQPAYGIESLVSDMGGQLGLWLGVSLLAFGELLELLFTMCYMLCCKAAKVKQSPEVKKIDVQPLVKF